MQTEFNINPVSSAITCDSNNLYIGDNAGILWVFKVNRLNRDMNRALNWAFNATSPIVGGIQVKNGVVYIGTNDGILFAVH